MCKHLVFSVFVLLHAVNVAEASLANPEIAEEFCYPVNPFYRDSNGNNSPDTMENCDVVLSVPIAPNDPWPENDYYWSGTDGSGYYPVFGAQETTVGYHLGFDFNGEEGGNSDYNSPVFAAADGYVERRFTDYDMAKTWGLTCVLVHYLENDNYDRVWTVYAHLSYNWCRDRGRFVRRGEQIGGIGSAQTKQGVFLSAHLHF